MAVKNRIAAIPMLSVDADTVSTSVYTPIYANLPKGLCIVRLINDSNKSMSISYDGTTGHDYLLPASYLTLDMQTNSQPNTDSANLPAGITVYMKAAASATGTVAVGGYYQPTQ